MNGEGSGWTAVALLRRPEVLADGLGVPHGFCRGCTAMWRMTSPLSIRFDTALLERLRRRALLHDATPSGLAQRLVDEGLRSQEHPGIVFRDGPSGRRAALVAGPDVWEVVAAVRSSAAKSEKRAITLAAAEMTLSPSQVQLALEYYGSFPAEIDLQITENERAAAEALEAWRVRRQLLA